tara:strand:+ start:2655 stop:3263 length:609 start_codon:yes stop_codon:yes gene_type:complete
MIVVAETTVEVVMTGVVVMTEETIVVIFQTMIGIVQSAIIPTSHSGLNVIAVVSQKEEAQVSVMTAEVVMTGVDVMTAEVVTTEETVAVIFRTTIGNVQSVIIPTSHSELNVTAVVSQKEEEAQISVMIAEAEMTAEVVMTGVVVMTEEGIQIQESGKVMTADLAIGEKHLSQELAIGNVLNVENQISLRETSVSVVDARKE